MSISSLKKQVPVEEDETFVYTSTTAPKPNKAFERYVYVVTPLHGLCHIQAWTRPIEADAHGSTMTREFRLLHEALARKYGLAKDHEFLKAGSEWNEPQDWMEGLRKKERVLRSYWTSDTTQLPTGIEGIQLDAVAYPSFKNIGAVSVTYELTNFAQCKNELDKVRDSTL